MKRGLSELRRIGARLASLVTRGVVSLVDDSRPTQQVQVETRSDEVADEVELLQPWGISFHPTQGSEVLVLAPGATQAHVVALCASDRSIRPTDASPGEGGLYNQHGYLVFLDQSGVTHLGARTATQATVRGNDLAQALGSYADAVQKAVAGITYAGSGSVSSQKAAADLAQAALQLAVDVNAALSNKVKTE